MQIFDGIITDRGSKYAVSGGPCSSPEEAKAFIKALCRKKKFLKATHNTWAFLQDSAAGKERRWRIRGRNVDRPNAGEGRTAKPYCRGDPLVWWQTPWWGPFQACPGRGAPLPGSPFKIIRISSVPWPVLSDFSIISAWPANYRQTKCKSVIFLTTGNWLAPECHIPNNLHVAGSDIFYFHGERAGVYARVNIEGRSFEILGPRGGYLPRGTLLTRDDLGKTRFMAILYGHNLLGTLDGSRAKYGVEADYRDRTEVLKKPRPDPVNYKWNLRQLHIGKR